MRIKRLELQGFKSFVDRTTLVFPTGVTAVVGPNGCGKSNIVDAIRWAMGEMGPKRLRGKSLEDMIFNGSETRKAMGMAEVTVVFDNAAGNPDLGPYASSPEIQVTRRLYRNGDSEYYLNRVPCRLRDIVTLFLDTGVGRDAYSIIEQGQVSNIVNSKPEDRRAMFEEVAGIHKYRHRREEAIRKMESTEQNLLRVADILAEVARQMNSLTRQAAKAERYKKLKSELRELDLVLSARRFRQAEAGLAEARERHGAAVSRVGDLSARVAAEDAAVETARYAVHEKELDLHARERVVHDLSAAISQGEQRLAFLGREIEAAEERVRRERAESAELAERRDALDRERAQLADERDRLALALEEGRAALAEREGAAALAAARSQEIESRIESHKSAVVDLLGEAGRVAGRAAGLESRRQELGRRTGENAAEEERLVRERGDLESRNVGVNESILRLVADRERVAGELAEAERALAEEAEALRLLEAERGEVRARLGDRRGRLASLRELEDRFEGLGAGVQAILSRGERAARGVLGLVAEQVDAPRAFETALEAVLGERTQGVVVAGHAEAEGLVAELRASDAGRAFLAPLAARPRRDLSFPSADEPGVVGRLRDFVKVREGAEALADALFGDAVVVESLAAARALYERNGRRCTFVTREGDLLTPEGAVVGGSQKALQGGVLRRRREIQELDAETAELEGRLAALGEAAEGKAARRAALSEGRERLRAALHEHDVRKAGLGKDLEQTVHQLTRLSERTRVLAYERGEIERSLLELDAELGRLAARKSEVESARAEREEAVRAAQAEREAFESVLRDAREAVTQAKMEAAALAERLGSLDRARETNARALEQAVARIRFLEGAVGEALAQIRSRREDAAAAETEVRKNLAARDEAERAKVAAFNELEDMRRALAEREHGVRVLRSELHECEGRVTELLLECQGLENALQRLVEQAEERYLERLPDLVAAGTLPEREEGDEELAERVGELRRKIESMGEVNLTAIEEYEELSQRHAFLSEQKADLEEAMAELRQTIAKINAATRKLFEDTFRAIDERFQQVMPRLFNGGTGHLALTDPENLLESGIEIHVQPPGKRLQTMTLLSGGEKALTAVSLLIAIFLTKPSPFCLFDEVDAPLDEANVGRFSDLIHEMADLSQFLLITHNKRTMRTADHLYGVTMQEPGVSKIVSVELESYAGA